MALVDLDPLRTLYRRHNEVGAEFPNLLADFLHPDAEFVEFAEAPGSATYRGRDAIVALFRGRFEAGAMRVEDVELTALDDRTALTSFRIRMRGSGSGIETAMRLWNLVTLDGSRIVRLEEFSDEAAALDAARAHSGRATSP